MIIYCIIQPRGVGKTTTAKYEFLKDPDNTLFICINNKIASELTQQINPPQKNIMSVETFLKQQNIKGKSIILDEYLFFYEKLQLYKYIMSLKNSIDYLYVFSTANVQYEQYKFNYVKFNKHKQQNELFDEYLKIFYYDASITFQKKYDQFAETEFYNLYYNFLTEKNAIYITTPLNYLSYPNIDYLSDKQKTLEYDNNFILKTKPFNEKMEATEIDLLQHDKFMKTKNNQSPPKFK